MSINQSNEGEDSPPLPNSERSSASQVESNQSEPPVDSNDRRDTSPCTNSKENGEPMAEPRRKKPFCDFRWLFGNFGPALPRSTFLHSPPSSRQSSCSAVDLSKIDPDCDAPPSAPLVAEEDSRTTSFLEALPKDLLVVERRDLIPVAASWSSNYNHTGPVQYGDKVYVLKEPALINRGAVKCEHDLYRGMASPDPSVQKKIRKVFEESFVTLDEARWLIHCRTFQCVVRLEGVCIVKEPCRRVTGLLLEYLPRGDLQGVLQSSCPTFTVRSKDLTQERTHASGTETSLGKVALPYQRKVVLALEVARIVERLHRIGIVHADLKPANFLVADDDSLRLCDFGLAFFLDQPPSIPEPRGTPAYMAPEVHAKGVCSMQSDIFAFGVILFEIMEQRWRLKDEDDDDIARNYMDGNVFYREPPGDDWPEEWRDLVVSCMAVRPEDRPPLPTSSPSCPPGLTGRGALTDSLHRRSASIRAECFSQSHPRHEVTPDL